MTRVLVTGASGFLGRPTLHRLVDRGLDVHVLARKAFETPLSVTVHQVDLHHASSTASLVAKIRPSHLLHLAWHADPRDYLVSPLNATWVASSRRLIDAFEEAGGERVVVAGTCLEYASSPSDLVEDESPLASATPYAAAKNELRAWLAARSSALGWSWGRIFQPYGPREPATRLVPSVIRSILQEEPALCTPGDQVRDLLFVDDVADAFASLLLSDVEGTVNIGSGVPVTVAHVAKTLARLLDRPELLRLGALPPRPSDPPRIVADVRRLTDDVGWGPKHHLEDGLLRTIDWWRTSPISPFASSRNGS